MSFARPFLRKILIVAGASRIEFRTLKAATFASLFVQITYDPFEPHVILGSDRFSVIRIKILIDRVDHLQFLQVW